MGTLILIVVIGVTILLGRYALAEGRRIESQKRFRKNVNDYDSGRSKNDPVNVWNKHKKIKI
jgi:hypothetical protein|tara:strand:- start:1566 stop:1751 length:186 start_codon:yes stop_codon:yes gene_type:complete